MEVEIWDAGDRHSYIYTENRSVAKVVRRFTRTAGTVYSRMSGPFGWQYRVRTSSLHLLKAEVRAVCPEVKIPEVGSLKTKELAPRDLARKAVEGRSPTDLSLFTPASGDVGQGT